MDIKNCDDYTFLHCVNVGILSIITGLKLGMSNRELKDLGVGALLHDIGKVMIPEQILKKNASLTDYEYEIIKLHSLYGYQILK
jgi:HD-GYP domain-containing protein (c-di-GMP phosphodiesterase class II)